MTVTSDVSNDAVTTLVTKYRQRSYRRIAMLLAVIALLAVTVLVDVMTGPASLSFPNVLSIIFNPSGASAQDKVIGCDLRLPIALMAVCVGAVLGVAGAEMQTILNNPLADPFTLGFSSAMGGAPIATAAPASMATSVCRITRWAWWD